MTAYTAESDVSIDESLLLWSTHLEDVYLEKKSKVWNGAL